MKKMMVIEALANGDPKYRKMLERMRILEGRIDELESELTEKQRNLIWDFWGLSTQMELRKLELACQHMEFVK